MGHSRRFDAAPATSGLPQSTDIIRPAQLVRLGTNKRIARSGYRRAPTCRLHSHADQSG
jgi:hypothetical protein